MTDFKVYDEVLERVVFTSSLDLCKTFVDQKEYFGSYDYSIHPVDEDSVMFDVKDDYSGKVYYRTNDYNAAVRFMENNHMTNNNYHIDYVSNTELDKHLNKIGEKTSVVDGVGKDAPMVVNEKGGKQSGSPYRMDLVPPLALLAAARVLDEGAKKYGERNWEKVDTDDHINHALVHLYSHLAGDKSDEHLQHAVVRLMMALELQLKGE